MARTFKVRSRDELMNAPDPQYLVDQIILEGGLAVLIGSPGAGKTFTALGLSLSICTNLPWLGYETSHGAVIYITSEGLNGLKQRLQAWEIHHQIQVNNFGYVCEAPQFLDEDEIDTLIENIRASRLNKPVLIVIDTLARHMVGGDENSALYMGEFVANADKLRAAFGCSVLIVHHTGKRKNNSFAERGSSALRGAADTMLMMGKSGTGFSISCEKQKDSEDFKDIPVRLLQVELPNSANSCVLVRSETSGTSSFKLDKEKEKILHALEGSGTQGLSTKEIRELTNIPESSYHRHREHLVKNGYIECGLARRYTLTRQGKEYALTLKTLPDSSHESTTTTPITPTPL